MNIFAGLSFFYGAYTSEDHQKVVPSHPLQAGVRIAEVQTKADEDDGDGEFSPCFSDEVRGHGVEESELACGYGLKMFNRERVQESLVRRRPICGKSGRYVIYPSSQCSSSLAVILMFVWGINHLGSGSHVSDDQGLLSAPAKGIREETSCAEEHSLCSFLMPRRCLGILVIFGDHKRITVRGGSAASLGIVLNIGMSHGAPDDLTLDRSAWDIERAQSG
jgi:hypothetical protein